MTGEIGYIGLGTMGGPMARRIAGAGHRLRIFDADPAACAAVERAGEVTVEASPAALAEACAIVLLCLPDPAAGRSVILGADGLATAGRTDQIVCDHSTVDPATALELAEALAARGAAYLECPVLGGRAEAESGQLYAVASGDEAAYTRVRPYIELVSRDHRYVGATGTASRYKSIQNGLGLVQWAAMIEALGILARSGADLDEWYDVVVSAHGMADTPLFRTMAKKVISGDTSPAAFLRIGAKDIALADAQARELGLDAPVFAAANALFAEALEMGLGDADITEVARVVERRYATRIRS